MEITPFTINVLDADVQDLQSRLANTRWPAEVVADWSRGVPPSYARKPAETRQSDEPGEYSDLWLIDPDGTNLRRVTPEISQFVAWSPDGQYLLVSGHALFVIRQDGTGRLELRAE